MDCVDRLQPSETNLDEYQSIGPLPSLAASEMGSLRRDTRGQEGDGCVIPPRMPEGQCWRLDQAGRFPACPCGT